MIQADTIAYVYGGDIPLRIDQLSNHLRDLWIDDACFWIRFQCYRSFENRSFYEQWSLVRISFCELQ